MFPTNYENLATNIKEYRQAEPLNIEDSKYLNCIEEIVISSLGIESGDDPASLKDKVSMFNQSLQKCQVRITPKEIEIWRTSNQPLLVEAAKFLEIKNLIDNRFPEHSAGCNIVIMKNDTLLAQYSRGYANMSSKEPMNITQHQHFGSVSKHFTAACVVHLANNTNKFSLNDDIRKHFPQLPRFYFNGHEVTITIDQLLTMRSGLPNMQALAFLAGIEDQDATTEEKLNLLTSQQKIDLSAEPGSQFNYCNTNYDILAKVIENVLADGDQPQKNLREYAQEHFFNPLGMTQTGFVDPDVDIHSQTIPGYKVGPKDELTEITTRNKTWGPCGIIGTPEDMVKWNGKCPHSIFDKLSESPVALQPDSFSYGRGINIGYFGHGRYKIAVHSGGIEGFMTRYFKVIDTKDEERSFGLFISSNSERLSPTEFDNFTSSLVNTWIGKNVIAAAQSPPSPKMSVPMSSVTIEVAQSLSGVYRVPGWGNKASIESKQLGENSLGFRFMPDSSKPKKGFDFTTTDEGTFFRSIDPPTATIQINDQGFLFSDLSQGVMGIQFERI